MKLLITMNNDELLIEGVIHIMFSGNELGDNQIRIYTHTKTYYLKAEDIVDISVEEWK